MFCVRLFIRQPRNVRRMCAESNAMRSSFNNLKTTVRKLSEDRLIVPESIFCNNEVNFRRINCFGFDYDYTLAHYSKEMEKYIFDEAKSLLVSTFKYHELVRALEFDPNFAIRGLHYDVQNGLFMKVDAYNNIQIDTVYRGLTPVPPSEIVELYNGTYIPKSRLMKPGTQSDTMSQLLDLFVIPEMNLIGNIIQLFVDKEIEFDPTYLYQDVSRAVRSIHKSGKIHMEISNSLDKYISPNPRLNNLLTTLKDNGKNLFIITNSDFNFINKGMIYLTKNKSWTEFFDVIVTNAKKPDFFISKDKPFRRLINGNQTWSRVRNFEGAGTYNEGNLSDFMEYTRWKASEIFYFGDHIYADLADVATTQGWSTGAIIPELSDEIEVMNTAKYRQTLKALLLLEKLINHYQHVRSPGAKERLVYWHGLRHSLRQRTKNFFNPYFGSLFRTYTNPSYFYQRISVYADLYTSSVNNLMRYPLDHHFYPRRRVLPHERELIPSDQHPPPAATVT